MFLRKTEKHTKMGKGEYSNVQHKTLNFEEKIKKRVDFLLIEWEPYFWTTL